MIMYSMRQIEKLQTDDEFFKKEGDKYCLVSLMGKTLSEKDVQNQANFCILQIIEAYKKNYLTKKKANFLINKIDALEYSVDMVGPKKVIYKMNKEIVEEELHIPHFNSLCIICDDIYDSYE